QDRNALRSVTGCFEESEFQPAKVDHVSILDATVREGGAGQMRNQNRGAGTLRQFAMAAHEISVKVSLDDVANGEAETLRFIDVDIDVSSRIDDRRFPFGPDQVRSLREAA